MVKVEIDNIKGLVQKVGSGVLVKDQLLWNKHAYQSDIVSRSHTGNHTLTTSNSGELHIINATLTMTFPAAATGNVGHTYSFLVQGDSALTLSPNASDKIVGAGAAGVNDKDVYLGNDGAFIRLVGDGNHGWMIIEVAGEVSREA
jgi:hypothetical protein